MKHTGGKWRGPLCALLLLAGGAARTVCGAPILQLETAYIDAGCHPAHDHFTQTIRLFNAGDETLMLQPPKGDCRCVVPVLEEEFIVPGASTVLCLDVDTEDSTGRIIRRVRIRSNDPQRPEVAVILDYRVQVPFRGELSRVVHGANAVAFYYQEGFRSAWFQVTKGQHINEDPGEQTNPLPSMFIMLRGKLEASIGGKQLTIPAGEMMFVPVGVTHEFWNPQDVPREMVILMFGEGA